MEKMNALEELLNEDYEKPTRCSKCGKMLKYVGIGEYKCEECGFTEYDDYGLVRAYLEKYPGANELQIERATGVSRKVINMLVRQGKFDVKKGASLPLGGNND